MATRLQQSFGELYVLLERPRIASRALAILFIVHTLLLGYSAYVHSPTLNEPAHLVAGLSHWKFGRFDIYSVNPPLVRMVAALPVMAVGYVEDWSDFYEKPVARPEFSMGQAFVKANGERSCFLFTIARWGCIPFSYIGAIVCYFWACELYGRPAGLLACAIWCFEPNILAHASLITPDAHASALGLAASYTFWRWLKSPTCIRAVLTGVVLGMAALAKTTLILFYPLWPLMWLVYRLPRRAHMIARDWLREAGMLALQMVIGIYVLNLGYGFEESFTKLNKFQFVSDLFTGRRGEVTVAPDSGIADPKSLYNRFANIWLGELPVPFPRNYLLGFDLQERDFEHYGRQSYLRGKWQDHGWWYYYLYGCAIKMPLGLFLLGLLALINRLVRGCHARDVTDRVPVCLIRDHAFAVSLWDEFILVFPAAVIITVVSLKTGFNEHLRYVLPAFPYSFIAVSQAAHVILTEPKKLFSTPHSRVLTSACVTKYSQFPLMCFASPVSVLWRRRMTFLPATVVSFLGSWLIASSLWIYPHSLSYFNESIGGPLNGPNHLLGSNVDWGQDLLYLRACAVSSCAHTMCVDPQAPNLDCVELSPCNTRLATDARYIALSQAANDAGALERFAWYRGTVFLSITNLMRESRLGHSFGGLLDAWTLNSRTNRNLDLKRVAYTFVAISNARESATDQKSQ